MASSTTPIPPTLAASTRSGACINGSTAHRWDAMRTIASGGDVATNTSQALPMPPFLNSSFLILTFLAAVQPALQKGSGRGNVKPMKTIRHTINLPAEMEQLLNDRMGDFRSLSAY